jgi:uncharacterized protein with von Willebrand factor type A (vWA) domain
MSRFLFTDAVERVGCPKCAAPAGAVCLHPSGRRAPTPHTERTAALSALPDFDAKDYELPAGRPDEIMAALRGAKLHDIPSVLGATAYPDEVADDEPEFGPEEREIADRLRASYPGLPTAHPGIVDAATITDEEAARMALAFPKPVFPVDEDAVFDPDTMTEPPSDDTLHAALAADDDADTGGLGAVEGEGARPTEPRAETTPTVLDVDRWGRAKGKELAESWKAADVAEHKPEHVADAHAALFEPEPRPSTAPAEPGRAAWWKQLMESPEYQALHGKTALDGGLSELASKSICDQWKEYAVENPEPAPCKDGEAPVPAPGSEGEPLAKTLKRMRSTAKALAEASDTVDTARDTAAALGLGGDGGAGFSSLDPKELTTYYNRIKGDKFLRNLMQMAGRMRTLCQTLQRTKTQHGRDDTVGVELSGDVSRLVPSELAQLACGIPELELLALDRVARRQALSRQYRGIERLGQGPIVVVVDESGSMHGEPVMTAKAIALALAWLARRQKRWIALIGFTGGRGMKGYNRIAFPPGKVDQDALIDWLKHFYSGGSDRDIPVKEIPADWSHLKQLGLPAGKTDVIMITDAIADVPQPMIETYRTWAKAEQARTYGICIGQDDAGDLGGIADRHWCVPDLSGSAVDAVLSI